MTTGEGNKVKTTPPKVDERPDQPYVGIRMQVHWSEFSKVIPGTIDEVFGWLGQHGHRPAGPPLMRYHVINMEDKMDVTIGVLVASAVKGDGRVTTEVLPAGRYASLIYTDVKRGYEGNKALIDWGAAQGLTWDQYTDPNGDGFGCRYELFLTGPVDDPDPAKWDTEVAIRLAD
jgi:effector-binding domain-containing protein